METKKLKIEKVTIELDSGIAWAGFWIMLGLIYLGGGLRWLFGSA